MNESKRQKIYKKIDEEVNLMIIYLRPLQSYLIHSILTSPPWGNGEMVLRLGWPKVAVAAKIAVKHVRPALCVMIQINNNCSSLLRKNSTFNTLVHMHAID